MENLNLLTVAVSSSALFDLTESDSIYQNEGLEAYRRYQIEHEEQVLEPGEGFLLVKKLLSLNDQLGDSPVEVILLSRNSADTGLRVFNSIEAHKLNITRAAFCSGDSPYKYIRAFGSDLFLSTNAEDVRQALDQQVAAATLIGSTVAGNRRRFSNQLKIAFDGDSVLFSDEAERVFQESGLDAFSRSEASSAEEPLEGGPFKNFLFALHKLQQQFSNDDLEHGSWSGSGCSTRLNGYGRRRSQESHRSNQCLLQKSSGSFHQHEHGNPWNARHARYGRHEYIDGCGEAQHVPG